MSLVPIFLAFPIIPIAFAVRWFVADWKYRRHMTAAGVNLSYLRLYDPKPYLIVSEAFAAESRVRAGEFGPEAHRLLASRSLWWKRYWLALIIGAISSAVIATVLK
jgi:hypothetical protein